MASRDYYEALGVPRDADQEAIQRAYRKLARRYHPDVSTDPAAEERFKEISEAYQVLADPGTRSRYDAFGPDFRQVPEDMDPRTWQRMRAGAGPAPGGEDVWAGYGPSFAAMDVDDLFGGVFGRGSAGGFDSGFGRGFARGFGGGGVRTRSRAARGVDQEAELELTLEEACRGGRRSLTLGRADGSRTVQVTIPAGVADGQRIRLAGQGSAGVGGAEPGDLYLTVRVRPHERYRVEGRDLYVDLPLAPWEAALGTTVAVPTPTGQAKVRVPAGTGSGRRLRLRGQGIPHPRGQAGDLYAEPRVVVPERLTDEERRLLTELSRVSRFNPREWL